MTTKLSRGGIEVAYNSDCDEFPITLGESHGNAFIALKIEDLLNLQWVVDSLIFLLDIEANEEGQTS